MKKLLALLGIVCLLAFSILTVLAAGTVPLQITWTDPNVPAASVVYVYTNSVNDTNGGLFLVATNAKPVMLTLERPSTQYIYIKLGEANSTPTDYVAPSEPSNIIRVRVLGNGQIRVN